jgi:hypothetical protein
MPSKNTVPPTAASRWPIRDSAAPVKAPFTWPNSSLCTKPSGIAPQFTTTKGLAARRDWPWIPRATSSFPVPVSPEMMTGSPLRLIFSMSAHTRPMTLLDPTRPNL